MDSSALLPCPFCCGTDIRIDRHESHRSPTGAIFSMCCYNCGATFPNRYKRELLVACWNRRDAADRIERLEKALAAADAMREFVPVCYASTTDEYAPNAAAAAYDRARAEVDK